MVYTTLAELRADVNAFKRTLDNLEEDFPNGAVAKEQQTLFTRRMETMDKLAWAIFSKFGYLEETLGGVSRNTKEDIERINNLRELHELRTEFEKAFLNFSLNHLMSLVFS